MLPSWLPTNVESPDANAVPVSIVLVDVREQESKLPRANYSVRANYLVRLVVLLAMMCMVLALFWRRETSAEVIEARQFLLRDSSGRVRAGLVLEHNEPTLFFADTSGKRISEYK